MRYFTVKRGLYKGIHKIYGSREEATEDGIKEIKSPWWHSLVVTGDWVESDDGYIIQCLNHPQPLVNKRHKSGQYTDFFRYCTGNAYVYYGKDGVPKPNLFYAALAYTNKNSLGNGTPLGKGLTLKKREFILYMSLGYDPYTAYIKTYSKRGFSPNIKYSVMKLLDDPVIREELVKALKPFMEKVQQKIQEQAGKNIDELIVDHTVEILLSKPTDVVKMKVRHEYELEMFGEQLGLVMDSKQSSKEIANASFEVLPPPQLGVSHDNI